MPKLLKRARMAIVWTIVLVLLAWGASALLISSFAFGRIFNRTSIGDIPQHWAAVVLGCSRRVRGGQDNLYFALRVDAAVELYKAGRVDTLIVSGDNHIEGYDEPTDMKDALVAEGVPADRIVCDYAGFRTLDSVVRAKEVFGLNAFVIVSQPAHLKRAVFLARSFGCDAIGYAAEDVNGRYSIKTTLREQLAKIAAVLDALVRRSPKFLGPREALPPMVLDNNSL